MTFEQETLWLAGLLEGEGCFSSGMGRNNKYNNGMKIMLMMTDEDVVRLAGAIMGTPVRFSPSRNPRCKDRWYTAASGDKAIEIGKRILPFMCARRKAKLTELLTRAAARMSSVEAGKRGAANRERNRNGEFGSVDQPLKIRARDSHGKYLKESSVGAESRAIN